MAARHATLTCYGAAHDARRRRRPCWSPRLPYLSLDPLLTPSRPPPDPFRYLHLTAAVPGR
eukprot:6563753-Pyramimonas_sp.AAC.1